MKAQSRLWTTVLPMVGILVVPAQALAQESPVAEEEAAGDEIIVIAQKRAENLQDVPVSIAAFSGEKLETANVSNVQELGRVATNFQTVRSTSVAAVRVNVRGIGAQGNSTIEPSVAIFVDGVYVPRAGAILGSFMDISATEVLRGPQGTLFGRNASVGALSLRTGLPEYEFSAKISAEYATADRYVVDGHVNIPIAENVAARFAGRGSWFDGYWTNRLDGQRYGQSDDQSFRGAVKGEFGNLELILRGDYAKTKGDGFANFDLDPSTISAAQLATLQSRTGGGPDINLRDNKANQFTTASLNDKNWGFGSDATLDLNGLKLRLINSYRRWENDQVDGDIVFTPAQIASRVGQFRSGSQNHELQFISPEREWLGGMVDFVGGLYYFQEKYRLDEQLNMGAQFCNLLVAVAAQRAACNTFLTTNGGQNATDQDVFQTVNSLAAYGQMSIHIADPLTLTLGGRWTQDKKSGSYAQRISTPFVASLRAPEVLTLPGIKDEKFTYRISLNYKPTDDVLIFANHSTGYKSGGYNSGGGTPALSTFGPGNVLISTRRLYDAENTKNYEIGAKTSWLDDSVRANITLYRMDISGYQDRSFDGVSFVIRNAGNLRQQGAEFDLVLKPTQGLSFSGSIAYLDSKFTNFPAASGLPGLGGVQNLKGKPATFSPKWSGNFGIDWSGDIGSSGLGFNVNTNLSLISDQFIGSVTDANPSTIEDGYALLGARFTLKGPDDRWSVALFGKNLTGTDYAYTLFYQPLDSSLGLRNGVFPGSTATRKAKGDPRTFGVAATFRF